MIPNCDFRRNKVLASRLPNSWSAKTAMNPGVGQLIIGSNVRGKGARLNSRVFLGWPHGTPCIQNRPGWKRQTSGVNARQRPRCPCLARWSHRFRQDKLDARNYHWSCLLNIAPQPLAFTWPTLPRQTVSGRTTRRKSQPTSPATSSSPRLS